MSSVPRDLDAFLQANDARIHEELYDFLRIPSVSARSEHAADVARAAEWVAASMRAVGLTAEVCATKGHPIVIGEWRNAGPGRPTVLIYGHYDVQPAKALEAHLKVRGELPVNVVVVAEGEEEVGSEQLAPFVEANAERLKCDAVVISDSAMFAPGLPSILSSLRGMAYFQIDVQGPSGDLHSGSYGGAVVNPAMALARILATFHDADGRVAIPGFYDDVREWPAKVREQMRALPFDEE